MKNILQISSIVIILLLVLSLVFMLKQVKDAQKEVSEYKTDIALFDVWDKDRQNACLYILEMYSGKSLFGRVAYELEQDCVGFTYEDTRKAIREYNADLEN